MKYKIIRIQMAFWSDTYQVKVKPSIFNPIGRIFIDGLFAKWKNLCLDRKNDKPFMSDLGITFLKTEDEVRNLIANHKASLSKQSV
ncbi:MAG: hypothetical protein ACRDBG_28480 [Waterburya sp.]